jgi:2,4-diaminopentanoate dehydrogenase
MKQPMKVLVWGPGGLGTVCIREISMLKEFELVGVYAYSAAKHGVDAGTLVGLPPLGIKASNNAAEMLAVDCDVVLYTARDLATFNNDDEILRLLAAGKNLVTALPYHYMHVTRPPEYVAKVEAACKQGSSVFHATGVNPDLVGERLLLALTGLCNDVRHVKMQENWDVSFLEPETFKVCGYGESPEVARQSPVVLAISGNFVKQGLMAWAETMGVTYERVTVENDYPVAAKDLTHGSLVVKKGTVCCITTRMCGYLKGQTKPFMTVEVNWAITHDSLPPGVEKVQGWVLTIDGRPSLRTVIDIKSDFATGERFIVPGDKRTEAGYHAVVATLLKAVPKVMKAPPGILKPLGTPIHWLPDLRNL